MLQSRRANFIPQIGGGAKSAFEKNHLTFTTDITRAGDNALSNVKFVTVSVFTSGINYLDGRAANAPSVAAGVERG